MPSQKQQIFGCYTITDDWTFVLGTVADIETEKPTLHIKFSPRYNGTADAEHIVQILKSIVSKHATLTPNRRHHYGNFWDR